jgi:hypothetical protein
MKQFFISAVLVLSSIAFSSTDVMAQKFEMTKIEQKFNDCKKDSSEKNPCLEISIEYPKVLGKFKNSKVVDDFIRSKILQLLSNYSEGKIDLKETIENAIKKANIDFKKENEGSTVIPWNYASSTKILFQSKKYISLVVHNYSYTGGAHGGATSFYTTFNINTGKFIKLDNIVKNKKLLLNIAEKKFRKEQSVTTNQTFENAGFWFKDNKFYLPDNYAIVDKGVLFQYGQYEIAPYSAGMIELLIENKDFKFNY